MMAGKLVFRVHAIARMFERRITEEEVRRTLDGGETMRALLGRYALSESPYAWMGGGATHPCGRCR